MSSGLRIPEDVRTKQKPKQQVFGSRHDVKPPAEPVEQNVSREVRAHDNRYQHQPSRHDT
jgi:hypothetical protein